MIIHLSYIIIAIGQSEIKTLARKTTTERAAARRHIEQLRSALTRVELLCSGTLSERMMKCGKPSCRCTTDPSARHGPYYQWGRMRGGKIARRYVTAEQAEVLRVAIANYHQVKDLLRSWEQETERLIDAEHPARD